MNDIDRARRNREMVASKQCIEAYLLIEKALENCPLDKPLPLWIPASNLPYVSDKDFLTSLKQLKEDYEFYET